MRTNKEAKLYEELLTFTVLYWLGSRSSPWGLEPPPPLLDLEVLVNPSGKDDKEVGQIEKRGRWMKMKKFSILFLYFCSYTI